MTVISSPFPPPVVFTHNEQLHRIALPPLGTFLSSLSLPEHLVKLNDILDRFRTPRSYHRTDVRVLGSSDLPPSETLVEEEEREWKEKGEPVVLVEGMDLDTWKALQRESLSLDARVSSSNGGPRPGAEVIDVIGSGEVTLPHETIYRSLSLLKSGPGPTTQLTLGEEDEEDDQIEAAPNSFAIPRAAVSDLHLLPPAAPKRRIRELRLDLRTLDAAALFALETWRREALGLEKLDMDVPDSIWYRDPEVGPAPTSAFTPTARRRGRPRRSVAIEVETGAQAVSLGGMDDGISQSAAVAEKHAPTSARQEETYQSLVEALEANGSAPAHPGEEEVSIALRALETVHQMGTSAAKTAKANAEAGSSRLTPISPEYVPSPSPDIILDDAFNEKDDADSDFIPEPATRSLQRRSGRKLPLNANESIDVTQEGVPDDPPPLGSWTNPMPITSTKSRKTGRRSDPGFIIEEWDSKLSVIADVSTSDLVAFSDSQPKRRGRPPRRSLDSAIALKITPPRPVPSTAICEVPNATSAKHKRLKTTFEGIELPSRKGKRKSVAWAVSSLEPEAAKVSVKKGLQEVAPRVALDAVQDDEGEDEDEDGEAGEWTFLKRF